MQAQGKMRGGPCLQWDHHQAQQAPHMAVRRVMDQQASSYLPLHSGLVSGHLKQHESTSISRRQDVPTRSNKVPSEFICPASPSCSLVPQPYTLIQCRQEQGIPSGEAQASEGEWRTQCLLTRFSRTMYEFCLHHQCHYPRRCYPAHLMSETLIITEISNLSNVHAGCA